MLRKRNYVSYASTWKTGILFKYLRAQHTVSPKERFGPGRASACCLPILVVVRVSIVRDRKTLDISKNRAESCLAHVWAVIISRIQTDRVVLVLLETPVNGGMPYVPTYRIERTDRRWSAERRRERIFGSVYSCTGGAMGVSGQVDPFSTGTLS